MATRSLARIQSLCSGEGCFPPRLSLTGSDFVFIEGRGIMSVGDQWAVHSCGNQAHAGVQTEGSTFLFLNGVPVSGMGHAISCGSVVSEGNDFVFMSA